MRTLCRLIAFGVAGTIQAQSADLAISKSGSPPVVPAGDNITYTISVVNNGPDFASMLSVTDAIPANTTYVSSDDGGGTSFNCFDPAANGGVMLCTANALFPAQTWTITLVVRVAPGASGATITNTANVTSNTPDPNTTNNSATTQTTVAATPPTDADVSVAKGFTGAQAFVGRGEVATYTITVDNDGPLAATGVTLTDVVPPQTTFESFAQTSGPSFSCGTPLQGATGTITCTIASLPDQATATFALSLRLDTNATGTVSNTATVAATTADPNPGNNTSTASVTATNPGADLRIIKTASPPTVMAGSDITYTLDVFNTGSQNAPGVVVSDFVPANTTFVSAGLNGGGSAGGCAPPSVTASGDVQCSLTQLGPQAGRTFTIVVRVNPGAAGATITNTATVSSSAPDPDTSNNSSTVQTPVSGVPPADADISVAKFLPLGDFGFVGPGEVATYLITVANDGPLAAVNFTLSDQIPAGTTFESFNQTAGPVLNCTIPLQGATGPVTCSTASFADQASASFTLQVRANANATGTISNTATVSSTTPDADTADNTSTSDLTVSESIGADIRLTKSADPATAAPGSTITYTVTATNIGSEIAGNVVITDPIPAQTTFVSVAEPPGTFADCFPPITTNDVRCTVGGLTPTQSFTMTFVVRVNDNATGTIANVAQVTSSSTDPVATNNLAAADTTVSGAGAAANIPLLDPRALLLLAIGLGVVAVTTIKT